MKDNWQTKKLDEVCNVEYGTRVVRKRDGGSIYPVYGGGGETFFLDSYNREDRMIIARFAMSKQCVRFVKGNFFLNDSGLTVSPKNNKEITQNFLNLQLLFLNDNIYSLAKGSAQKNLDVPAFRNMNISYPESISEQQKLVTILDNFFEKTVKAKENTKKNLQNSRELFESYLQNIFINPEKNWIKKSLGDVARIVMGQSPKGETYNSRGEGLPLINGPVEFGIGQLSETHITKYTTKPTKICKKGDLIVCVRGSTTGKTNIAGCDSCLGRGVASITADKNIIDQNLLNIYIASLRKFIYKIGTGATFPNVSSHMLSSIKIAFPPLSQQESIVMKLESLSVETKKLEEKYKQKLADLEELKKSVLAKAFSGQL